MLPVFAPFARLALCFLFSRKPARAASAKEGFVYPPRVGQWPLRISLAPPAARRRPHGMQIRSFHQHYIVQGQFSLAGITTPWPIHGVVVPFRRSPRGFCEME